MAKRRYSRAQIWEFTIVLVFIVVMTYRYALVYDFVPDQYQPSTIFYNVYDTLKDKLKALAAEHDTMGEIAQSTLEHLKLVELKIKAQQQKAQRQQQIAEKCKENMFFRFFMGDLDSPNCMDQNQRLQAAMQDLDKAATPIPIHTKAQMNGYTTSSPVVAPTQPPAAAPTQTTVPTQPAVVPTPPTTPSNTQFPDVVNQQNNAPATTAPAPTTSSAPATAPAPAVAPATAPSSVEFPDIQQQLQNQPAAAN